MSFIRNYLLFAILAVQGLGVFGFLPDPDRKLQKRATYPACSSTISSKCILDGNYLFPELDWSNVDSAADTAYKTYLPKHDDFVLSNWTNNKIPERCYHWGVAEDRWNAADFKAYNVTFSDCAIAPFVICMNKFSPRDASAIASEIGRIPAPMRQSASMFMVYGDNATDNPFYAAKDGFFGTLAGDGILIGRSKAFYATAIIHELGHAIDSTLVSPDAVHPNPGSPLSRTSTWRDAGTADGYAISSYGAESGWADDFADTGRAVLLDSIYPGGWLRFLATTPT